MQRTGTWGSLRTRPHPRRARRRVRSAVITALAAAVVVATAPWWRSGFTHAAAAAAAPAPPPGFTQTLVAHGLNNPDVVTFSPAGQLWVATKVGGIYRMEGSALQTVATLAVDSTAELGLTGLAFDPQFATNGYIYVSYVTTGAFSQLSRFTVVNGVAGPATEKVLVRGTQQQTQFGPGEAVQVGPDGKLWWSVGSNPYPWGNGQSLTNIYGKIIRLNLDGSVPADDPFVTVPGVAPGVYAWGLRNPWRFTFLPTGQMMVGNTGESTWEMLETIQPGSNYGWPFYEGNCFSCGYVNPTYSYGHVPTDGAVSAVVAYRGTAFPSAYDHVVFFGDYNRGDIEAVTFDPTYQTVLSDTVFDSNAGSVADLTEGPDGSLYYADVFGDNVWKITATGPFPPAARASVSPNGGAAPATVQLSSAGSVDAYGKPLAYSWDFGDGSGLGTTANPTHTYTTNGTFTPTLTVSNGASSATATTTVVVGRAPPAATITSPTSGTPYNAGTTMAFAGSASDGVDGSLPAADFSWQVDFFANGVATPSYLREVAHPFLGPVTGVTSGTFTVPTDVSQLPGTFYRITLTAVNSAGETTVVSQDVHPNLTSWTATSNVSGAGVFVDGTWHTATDTVQDVMGVRHVLMGGPEQVIAGQRYRMGGWSDGSGLTDSFTSTSAGDSHTANYEAVSPIPAAGWSSTDVGTPALPGSAESAATSATTYIDGGGVDIGVSGEQFHYVYQSLTGDGVIVARVRYQTEAQPWSKAGVLIKQSTVAGSPFAAAMVTPDVSPTEPTINGVNCTAKGCDAPLPPLTPAVGHGVLLQSTNGTASVSAAIPGYAVPNKWLKLQRSGNDFTASYSLDGSRWTPIGAVTVAMSGPVTVGLFVASHQAHQFSTAAFDNVSVTPLGPPPPPPTCPAGWTCSDIGGPSLVGSASANGPTWTIKGAGSDIHGTADQFQFDYRTMAADGAISAHVLSQDPTSAWAKAGVMLRAANSADAVNYTLLVTPGNGVFVQYRSAPGGVTTRIATVPGSVPAYLEVRRTGTTFTAFTSPDGSTWTALAGSTVTLAVSGPLLEGLAVASHNSAARCTVTMDTVAPT